MIIDSSCVPRIFRAWRGKRSIVSPRTEETRNHRPSRNGHGLASRMERSSSIGRDRSDDKVDYGSWPDFEARIRRS